MKSCPIFPSYSSLLKEDFLIVDLVHRIPLLKRFIRHGIITPKECLDFLNEKTKNNLNLKSTNLTLTDLTYLSIFILGKLGISSAGVFVEFENKSDDLKKNCAAHVKTSEDGNIEIKIKKNENIHLMAYIGILAHECMHIFLNEKNFSKSTEIENEKATDIATILCGFGIFTIEACYLTVESRTEGDVLSDRTIYTNTHSESYGYIDKSDALLLTLYYNSLASSPIPISEIEKHISDKKLFQDTIEKINLLRLKECKFLYNTLKSHSKFIIKCSTCFTPLRIPACDSKIKIFCPSCAFAIFFDKKEYLNRRFYFGYTKAFMKRILLRGKQKSLAEEKREEAINKAKSEGMGCRILFFIASAVIVLVVKFLLSEIFGK